MRIKYDGAIYEQIEPFHPIEHDWNNDGDIYTEIVTVFELVRDENKNRDRWRQPRKRLVLSKWEFADMMADKKIEII